MKRWTTRRCGAPRVFLHGFSGAPESFERVVAELPDDRTQVAPPLLGHGHHGADSFSAEVARLANAIREADLAPAHLIGYSMGARLGLGLVVEHPDVVERATLIGVSPGIGDDEARRLRRQSDQRWIEKLETEGIEPFVADWEAMPMWASQRQLPESVRAEQRAVRLASDAAGLARAIRVVGQAEMPYYRPRLHDVTVPVQILVGQRDEKFVRLALGMQRENPRFDMAAVDGCGHNPVLERPDLIASHIVEWEGACENGCAAVQGGS